MKKTLAFITFFMCFCSFNSLLAQDGIIPNPEFNSRPYILNNGELENIERTDATMEVKSKGLGYGGVEIYYTAFGSESNTRFNKESLPRIFIKLEGNIDPSEIILIVKEDTKRKKKDRRRFKQGSMKLGGGARDISENQINFSVKKIRDDVYEIILDIAIEPGEYAFMPISDASINPLTAGSTKTKISCFGIN